MAEIDNHIVLCGNDKLLAKRNKVDISANLLKQIIDLEKAGKTVI